MELQIWHDMTFVGFKDETYLFGGRLVDAVGWNPLKGSTGEYKWFKIPILWVNMKYETFTHFTMPKIFILQYQCLKYEFWYLYSCFLFLGIGLCLFSYDGRVRAAIVSDKVSLPNANDVQDLIKEFEYEIENLSLDVGAPSCFT